MTVSLVAQGETILAISISGGETNILPIANGPTVQLDVSGGAPGPSGADADNIRFSVAASANIAAGMPVAIDRATGRLVAADAAVKNLSFVAGVLAVDVAAGFAGSVAPARLTLANWTAATGSAVLLPGQVYFLGSGGGLTTLAPAAAASVVIVGKALDPTTLEINPSPPIQL